MADAQAFQTAMGLFKPNSVFFLGEKEILNDINYLLNVKVGKI
jgi:hypothetical protein